ncbi:LPD29 domain-containing protein [Serratia sp. 14-2641]|uniref:LPD29 domain-containing protein n=1 Tax=Serratia sp. 14-2641 TaxID=1841657 RepID=UPI0009F4F0BB|nr:LPD29 domain-containing protein [Serratia sp. 14-2641]
MGIVKTNMGSKKIVVGQIVSTNLYGRGRGVIYLIQGEQTPETVSHRFGGVMVLGGNATFDIAFESGGMTHQLPECILHGVQWTIHDEVLGQNEIDRILINARAEVERKDTEKKQAQKEFQDEIERLKNAPEYSDLSQEQKGVSQVTANIRKELKKAYPGVKFGVRKRHTCSVEISWTDGPKEDEIKIIAGKYKDGHFNSMADIYEYCDTPFNKVYGGVKYLFIKREFSDVLTEKAIQEFNAKFGDRFENVNLDRYKSGELWRVGFGDFWHRHGVEDEINKMRAELTA